MRPELVRYGFDDQRHRRRDRRQRKRPFRVWERRTGFDRRRTYPLLDPLRERPWRLGGLLMLTFGLSLLDGTLTAKELAVGVATEGNPLLSTLIGIDPWAAAAFKLAVTVLVVSGVWFYRWHRSVMAVGLVSFGTYCAVVLYHLGALSALGLM